MTFLTSLFFRRERIEVLRLRSEAAHWRNEAMRVRQREAQAENVMNASGEHAIREAITTIASGPRIADQLGILRRIQQHASACVAALEDDLKAKGE